MSQFSSMYQTRYDEERKEWSGPKGQSIFNLKASLGDVILNVLRANGPRIAQICADTHKTTTFQELYESTMCIAANLQRFGCKKGNVIYLKTDQSATVAPLAFAALYLGCAIGAQPNCCTKAECFYFLSTVKPNYVFCDLSYYSMIQECLTNHKNAAKIFTFDGQMEESIPIDSLFQNVDENTDFCSPEIDGITDTAYIMQSSGTTGTPKSVRLSHATMLDKPSVMTSSDVALGFTHLDGISGIRTLLDATLNGAMRIVNPGTFTPERFFELVERFKVTFTLVSPFTAIQLLNCPRIENADLSSFKWFIGAGSNVSLDIIQKMAKYFGINTFCNAYGMTELGGPVARNLCHMRNHCVGQLIRRCTAKIINEQGDRLGINQVGELCIKQDHIFFGYIGCDQWVTNYCDSEGFFATGDIAYFDEHGDLFIVERKRQAFKCHGFPVSPNEIEGFVNKINGVNVSCVVPVPDFKGDSIPAAFIIRSENSTCTETDIFKAVSDHFAPYKWLHGGIYFVDSLPVTASGKIARGKVTQLAVAFSKSQ